ncbi:MAG: glycosyltransferase [Candidatus Oleimicrobiaceae bacterium]
MSPFVDSWRILLFVAVQLIVAVANLKAVPQLQRFRLGTRQPRVSVLVPARNEESDIAACLSSLRAQNYSNFEVLVLDDHSADGTRAAIEKVNNDGVRVLSARPIPPGWNGKPWACQQLAAAASGELLFFTDADTVHHPETLARAVAALRATGADLLTALTGVRMKTMGELLTVPFPLWSIFTLLPVPVAYALRKSGAFVAGNGKFLLFRRECYETIGGHAATRSHAAEDMEIARLAKKAGFCWRLVNATGMVSARLYGGWSEAREGFAKNYFALFNYRLLAALFVWSWLMLVTWHPLVTVVTCLAKGALRGPGVAALCTIGLTCVLWLVVAHATRMPKRICCFYVSIITASAYIGLESIVRTVGGRTSWKGRTLVRQRVRLP